MATKYLCVFRRCSMGNYILNMMRLNTLINYFKKTLIGNTGDNEDFSYLRKIPRYQPVEVTLFSHKFKLLDSASFLFQYNEIFKSQIYKFATGRQKPYILDCGANIGLSIIYFKRLYPKATIIGFEPDKHIFDILTYNIKSFKFTDVKLIKKGLWNKAAAINFFSEGADGGRIAIKHDKTNLIKIKTLRLRMFLKQSVDFLKLDIEGAETRVLEDCQDLLCNVKNLFVEYHSFIDQPQTLDKLLKILLHCSFRYYVSNIGAQSKHPFLEKAAWMGMDNQLNIYATKKE